MSYKLSFTLPQAELNKLCGQSWDLEELALKPDLYEEFLAKVETLEPVATVECSDCGYRAQIEYTRNGLGLLEITASDLEHDCLAEVAA